MKTNINRLIAIYSLTMANALVGTGISPALSAISVETLTPIEAMNELYKLKKMLG